MKVGITGHQHLPGDADWAWVAQEIAHELDNLGEPIEGLSSLAVGADQLFAELVLEHRGRLIAIIPFPDYASTFQTSRAGSAYRRLLGEADEVVELPSQPTRQLAYLRAGQRVVDDADLLIAVWDGLPAEGLGGTADVVAYALNSARRVVHLNPTARRVSYLP